MSRLGKWLLSHCDNNLRIDLRMGSILRDQLQQAGFKYDRAKTVALFLGLTLEGGS
jgi:hypothetical protein